MSGLNLISLLGLFAMIGLAWLMSSYRRRVNWRLVVWGVLLQLLLAAIFFNSQNWKFSREFSSLAALLAACDAAQIDPQNVDLPFLDSEDQNRSFATAYQRYREGQWTVSQVTETYRRNPASTPVTITVPRFPNGVVFYGIEGFFGLIQRSVEEGTSLCLMSMRFHSRGKEPLDLPCCPRLPLVSCPQLSFFHR